MDKSFIVEDTIYGVLKDNDASALFMQLYYLIKSTLPEVVIRGKENELIGVSLPSNRFLFYMVKKGDDTFIKFRSGKLKRFHLDQASFYIKLSVNEAKLAIKKPKDYQIKHNDSRRSKDNSIPRNDVSVASHFSNDGKPFYELYDVNPDYFPMIEVKKIPMSCRARNCLKSRGITSFSDLLRYNEEELRAIPQLGNKTLQELKSLISSIVTKNTEKQDES